MTKEELEEENKALKELLLQNGILKKDKSKAFSDVKMDYLKELKIIKQKFDDNKFDNWFHNNIDISREIEIFLQELL
ncbi:MAG: hypothetical protein U9Q30_05780, partial [Campylobacterota bacterium]|nr:hypothetical protein [Campylobacterota bacterium]